MKKKVLTKNYFFGSNGNGFKGEELFYRIMNDGQIIVCFMPGFDCHSEISFADFQKITS